MNVVTSLEESERRFSEDSQAHYQVTSLETLLEDPDKVLEMVENFKTLQLPRLEYLKNYLEANNVEILSGERRKEKDMTDVRAVHDYGGYITTFFQGFITANPFEINYGDTLEEDNLIEQTIRSFDSINSIKAHNSSVVRDGLAYGRGYEILYRDRRDKVRVQKLDPLSTFLIYDSSVEHYPLAGVRFYFNPFEGEDGENFIDLYTDEELIRYKEVEGKLEEVEREPHGFGENPINELSGDEARMGVFEKVLSLIDLYDSAQSDTANYMQDFNDAILGIFGDIALGTDDPLEKIDVMSKMRKARLMHFVPPKAIGDKEGNVDAKYLTKSYDVSGAEAYKDRVSSDIHKFSFTPDLQDDNFAGVQSGQAMKYKLFGLEVLAGEKENLIQKFLSRRYTLLMNISQTAKETSEFDIDKLSIKITPKLPRSLQESIENFMTLDGELTNETKMRITGVVENPKEEQSKLEEDNPVQPVGSLLDKKVKEDELLEG